MRKLLGGMIAIASLISAPAISAETGYLTIKGQKSGEIKGEVTSKGHEGAMEVVALGYMTSVPTSSSGLATGRRVMQPVSFTLRWSKATPLLLAAATTNETLTQVRYQGWGPKPDGTTAELHEIALTNARIVSLDLKDRNGDENAVDPLVTITLSYQKLDMTQTDGGITATDDWSAAN